MTKSLDQFKNPLTNCFEVLQARDLYKKLSSNFSDDRTCSIQRAALRATLSLAISTFSTKKICADWILLFQKARSTQLYDDQYVQKAVSLLKNSVRNVLGKVSSCGEHLCELYV